MTTPDMMEALQALAAEKGMTTELLQIGRAHV